MVDVEGQATEQAPVSSVASLPRFLFALGCVVVFVLDVGFVLLGVLGNALAGVAALRQDDWEYHVASGRFVSSWLMVLGLVGCAAALVAWRWRRAAEPRPHRAGARLLLLAAFGMPVGWLTIGMPLYEALNAPPLPIVRESTTGQLGVFAASTTEPVWSGEVECDWLVQGSTARVEWVGPIDLPIAGGGPGSDGQRLPGRQREWLVGHAHRCLPDLRRE